MCSSFSAVDPPRSCSPSGCGMETDLQNVLKMAEYFCPVPQPVLLCEQEGKICSVGASFECVCYGS